MSLKTTFMKKLAAKAKKYFSLGAQREGWLALIRWVQNKCDLWAWGEVAAPILDPSETFSPIRSADFDSRLLIAFLIDNDISAIQIKVTPIPALSSAPKGKPADTAITPIPHHPFFEKNRSPRSTSVQVILKSLILFRGRYPLVSLLPTAVDLRRHQGHCYPTFEGTRRHPYR